MPQTALHYAIQNEDHKAIRLLWAEINGDYNKRQPRAGETRSVLRPETTGTYVLMKLNLLRILAPVTCRIFLYITCLPYFRYNWRSLGIKKIRKVQMSRGGKEGNNALTKVTIVRVRRHSKYQLNQNIGI